MENNQSNANDTLCDLSTDASCTDKVIKHNEFQSKVVVEAIGLANRGYGVEHIIGGLVKTGTYQGTKNHLYHELNSIDAELKYTFTFLSKKLDTKVKQHLKALSVSYDSSDGVMYRGIGGLKYEGKIFYTKELHDDDMGGVPVSPSNDDSLGYKFFMYRLITSSAAYRTIDAEGNYHTREFKTRPTHVVTFDKNSEESYTNVDVMRQFQYVSENGRPMETHIGNVVNKNAFNVMVADRESLKDIIKLTFKTHLTHCNTLKNVDPSYKELIIEGVCAGAYEREDQDYFVQYVTCHEVFTLASIDEFCPDMIKEVPDYFDDL